MYAKVFRQMYDGTLATSGPWEALVTFQQMLVLANDNGEVDMTPSAISRVTTIPLNIIERGIGALCAPDPESRTPDLEGRRLVPLAEGRTWGWRIVNYLKYRAIQKEAERREYHRRYYHEKRKPSVERIEIVETQQISTGSTGSTDTEAEAEAEAKERKEVSGAALRATPPPAVDWNDSKTKGIHPIPAAWELPESWGLDAEALGWKPRDVWNESIRFRMYWTTGKGAGKRRSVKGWRSSWTNWLSKAERMAA